MPPNPAQTGLVIGSLYLVILHPPKNNNRGASKILVYIEIFSIFDNALPCIYLAAPVQDPWVSWGLKVPEPGSLAFSGNNCLNLGIYIRDGIT